MSTSRAHATRLLAQLSNGNASVTTELFPVVYDQLKDIAAAMLRQERQGHTLQPTALVNEAYLRLVDLNELSSEGDQVRDHFLVLAARAMRRILVDHARARGREKRGGALDRVTLDESMALVRPEPTSMIDLEAALQQLEAIDPRLVQAAELRLFAGLSVREMSAVMGLSLTRGKVVWASAQVMLHKLLAGS